MEQALEQTRLVQVTPPGYQTAWQVVIGQLRHDMRRGDYDSWVVPLQPLSFKEGVFRVGAHNSFGRDWVESRLRVQLSNLLEMVLGQKVSLRFTLIHESAAEEQRTAQERAVHVQSPDAFDSPTAGQPAPTRSAPTHGNAAQASGLNRNGATGRGLSASTGSGATAHGSSPSNGKGSRLDEASASNGTAARVDPPSATSPRESLPGSAAAQLAASGTTLAALDLAAPVVSDAPASMSNGQRSTRSKKTPADEKENTPDSPRKIQLQRAYGSERARVIQPERGMFLTLYFFNQWLPLIGHSAMTTILAARSLCYWNPLTGEVRNVVETEMSDLAARAAVSVRTIKDVLNNPLVKKYFLRYKVRRVMTPNGVRTAGIIMQVRMDDPLTPEDQDKHHLTEEERWYKAEFEDERED